MTSAWPTDLEALKHGAGPSWQQRVGGWLARLFRVEEPMVLFAGAMLAGVGVYFTLPIQPGLSLVVLVCVLALVCLGVLRRSAWFNLGLLAVFACGGFAISHGHTVFRDTPLLWAGRMPWVTVQATITHIDYRDDSPRLFLGNVQVVEGRSVGWLNSHGLQVRPQGDNVARPYAVGQQVKGRLQLFPIGPPPVPGSLDLQFRAYFQGVSAYAATRGPLEIVAEPPPTSLRVRIEAVRDYIRSQMLERLGPRRGSVLVAMSVGFPRGIPDDQLDALRGAGLAHLLAISGLHMSLVVGGVFFAMRLVLVFIQVRILPAVSYHLRAPKLLSIAWRIQPKKLAMILALGFGLAYFLISGQGVPVQRAFTMAALFATAIILNRRAISMRTLAIAAMIVMVVAPHVVLGPSFQMSFAAVSALVLTSNLIPRTRHVGFGWSTLAYVIGVASTSAIATLATATLTLFHFGQVSLVSVLANVVAVPIAAFVVMPAALIALVLMPLGADGWALDIAALGLDAIQAIAKWSSGLPASQIRVGGWPRAVPALFACAIVLAMALHKRGKLVAIVPLVILAFVIARHRPADIIITPDLGVATPGFVSPQVDDFQTKFMAEYWAKEQASDGWQQLLSDGLGRLPGVVCSPQACVLGRGTHQTTLVFTRQAADMACGADQRLIALLFVPTWCLTVDGDPTADADNNQALKQPSISTLALGRSGPYAIWINRDGSLTMQSDADRRGVRPWSGRGRSD